MYYLLNIWGEETRAFYNLLSNSATGIRLTLPCKHRIWKMGIDDLLGSDKKSKSPYHHTEIIYSACSFIKMHKLFNFGKIISTVVALANLH